MGKRAFSNGQGNSMEGKFDPNEELGNSVMSPTDVQELNKLYQCHSKKNYFIDLGQNVPIFHSGSRM